MGFCVASALHPRFASERTPVPSTPLSPHIHEGVIKEFGHSASIGEHLLFATRCSR